MKKLLEIVRKIEAFHRIEEIGGEIFLVGGCVRDVLLGKESKDIDLIIRKIPIDIIISELKNFGKVDQVGETFGVIKFSPFGWIGEPFDIAQPRKDVLIDKELGHLGIKAEFDKDISIIDDLYRRDITLNSIALSMKGVLIDPYNGLEDVKNKKIRATSPDSFTDDPLRMLRCVGFASRFGFDIEENTFEMIKSNVTSIKYISSERILGELDKICIKGDIQFGIDLLVETGLYFEIFQSMIDNSYKKFKIKNKTDFYFSICKTIDSILPSENYKKILKGEIKIEKGIKAIEHLNNAKFNSLFERRKCFYEAIQISDSILTTVLEPDEFKTIKLDFITKKLPNSYKDLSVNGDDLIKKGFKGVEIGEKLKEILYSCFM